MAASANQLQLLRVLQSRKQTRINDLVEILGVTRRSVFRYLKELQESGIQIFWSAEDGYYLPKGVSVPSLSFTELELTTVLAGLGFLKSQNESGLSQPAAGVERRILSQLPPDSLAYFNEVRSSFSFNPNQSEAFVNTSSSWFTIVEAIATSGSIRFLYKKSGQFESESRLLQPFQLVFYFEHWTVIGYDPSRKSLRSFVVDQIFEAHLVKETYAAKPVLHDILFRSSPDSFDFVVEVNQAILAKFLRAYTGPIVSRETKESSTILTLRSDNESYITSWLLQFGTAVTLLSPQKLIDARETLLRDLLEKTKLNSTP